MVINAVQGKPLPIYGDGLQSRDFTFVTDVVQANLLAAKAPNVSGEVFNVGSQEEISINELAHRILCRTPNLAGITYQLDKVRSVLEANGDSSKPTFRCVGERSPAAPLRARDQFEWSHSKCTGSIEFSWHWNQLHGTSENTICTKPFAQVKGSQVGTSGTGGGPR